MKNIIFIFSFICSQSSFSKEIETAFRISFHNYFYRAIFPQKLTQHSRVIVENKTNGFILGKIQDDRFNNLAFLFIAGRRNRSFFIKNFKDYKQLFYIPLSPPLQAIPLTAGQLTYEIPSKK